MSFYRITKAGYVYLKTGRKQTPMHRFVAEMALGGPLPDKAVVHHVDGNRLNNFPENLVICKDQEYHKLIHSRLRALEDSGSADNIKCRFCGCYDEPERMIRYKSNSAHHRECNVTYQRTRYEQRKQK